VSVTRFATPLPSKPPMRRMGFKPVALGVTSLGAPSMRKTCTVPFSLDAATSGDAKERKTKCEQAIILKFAPYK
jgi:hypothetical protein